MWVRNAQILNGFANSFFTIDWSIQGSAKRRSPGLVNFVAAVAYHFCLALPAVFSQPGAHLFAEPCPSRFCLFVPCHHWRRPLCRSSLPKLVVWLSCPIRGPNYHPDELLPPTKMSDSRRAHGTSFASILHHNDSLTVWVPPPSIFHHQIARPS